MKPTKKTYDLLTARIEFKATETKKERAKVIKEEADALLTCARQMGYTEFAMPMPLRHNMTDLGEEGMFANETVSRSPERDVHTLSLLAGPARK